jgi:2'-5' RNA ligase
MDMHMTLVFLGSSLRGPKSPKRAQLEECMRAFDAEATTTGDLSLKFDSLELFPPSKRNLLIARYLVDGAALEAIRALQNACFEAGAVSLEEHTALQNTPFVAHVTLGKFRGMRTDQISAVDKAVATVNKSTNNEQLSLPFQACCLCGGG